MDVQLIRVSASVVRYAEALSVNPDNSSTFAYAPSDAPVSVSATVRAELPCCGRGRHEDARDLRGDHVTVRGKRAPSNGVRGEVRFRGARVSDAREEREQRGAARSAGSTSSARRPGRSR